MRKGGPGSCRFPAAAAFPPVSCGAAPAPGEASEAPAHHRDHGKLVYSWILIIKYIMGSYSFLDLKNNNNQSISWEFSSFLMLIIIKIIILDLNNN